MPNMLIGSDGLELATCAWLSLSKLCGSSQPSLYKGYSEYKVWKIPFKTVRCGQENKKWTHRDSDQRTMNNIQD